MTMVESDSSSSDPARPAASRIGSSFSRAFVTIGKFFATLFLAEALTFGIGPFTLGIPNGATASNAQWIREMPWIIFVLLFIGFSAIFLRLRWCAYIAVLAFGLVGEILLIYHFWY
jgi:hypothetical protein